MGIFTRFARTIHTLLAKALGKSLCKRCGSICDQGTEYCEWCITKYANAITLGIGVLNIMLYEGQDDDDDIANDVVKWLYKLPPSAFKSAAQKALTSIADALRRRQHHRNGEWVTAGWRVIPVRELGDEHLENIIQMLQRKASRWAQAHRAFYASCPEPHGEAAMDAFLQEEAYWLDYGDPESDYLARMPIWPHLKREFRRRAGLV